MKKERGNPYLPESAVLLERSELTSSSTLYRFSFLDGRTFHFNPGQFLSITVPGAGEAPFSITSAPSKDGTFELCIKRVGRLTDYLFHTAKPGMTYGVRGPYGRGFPLNEMEGKDILFIAGGIGYAPLRSVLLSMVRERNRFGHICFLFGVNTPADMIFRDEIEVLVNSNSVRFYISLVEGDLPDLPAPWKRGFVTDYIEEAPVDPANSFALLVGPPVMYRTAVEKLFNRGFDEETIFLSLERRMECGIGKCGHCAIGYKYTCIHGPVFPYFEAITLHEAI